MRTRFRLPATLVAVYNTRHTHQRPLVLLTAMTSRTPFRIEPRGPRRERCVRAALGIAVMVLASIGGIRPPVAESAETPVEIIELRHEFETGARTMTSRHRLHRGHHGEIVAPQWTPDHAPSGVGPAVPMEVGHRLANGLRAPLRC